jgi:hypothetical protein
VPDLDGDRTGGHLDVDDELRAIGLQDRENGEEIEVVDGGAFLLPAVGIEGLLEVTFLIKETNAHEGKVLVGGGFQVVAAKDAEATRVNGHAFGQAIFHREIGNETAILISWWGLHVGVEAFAGALVNGEIAGVCRGLLEDLGAEAAEHEDRVVRFFPHDGVQAAEEGTELVIPAPENVVGNFRETGESVRDGRADDELGEWLDLKGHESYSGFEVSVRKGISWLIPLRAP